MTISFATGLIAMSILAWRSLGRYQLLREARLLEHRLRAVVIESIASRKTLTLRFEPQVLHVEHPDGTRVSHAIHRDVQTSLSAASAQHLTLFGHGVSSPGTVLLSNGEFHCSVSLSLRGRVRRLC